MNVEDWRNQARRADLLRAEAIWTDEREVLLQPWVGPETGILRVRGVCMDAAGARHFEGWLV